MRRICLVLLALVFEASAAHAQPGPSSNLAAVFNTGANIGFSVIRAAFSPPDQRPPQAAAEWMLKDMANARGWSAAVRACITFDATRFDAAAAQVQSGTVAGRLVPMFEQLYRDYQAAVRASPCTFGLPTAQNVESFFVASVLTGSATARASYFYYPTPIPSQVVGQIRQDFTGMRLGLPTAAACIGTMTPIATRIDEVERGLASAAGQASYTELVGIYQQIEQAAGVAACAGTPPAPQQPAACTAEVLIRTSCASVCPGAGVLLGVVQGGPDCIACVNRGCPRQ